MRVIPPDFDRLIDLPGLEGATCPVDVDRDITGFGDLTSFRVLDLADTAALEGETGAEEIAVVLLAGAVVVSVTGPGEAEFRLDADGDWAVLLPLGHGYGFRSLVPATLALATARSLGSGAPRAFRPRQGVLAIDGSALHLRLVPLDGETDASAGLGNEMERLIHLTGPARAGERELPPMHTLALAPGEDTQVSGGGELLSVGALRSAAAAGP